MIKAILIFIALFSFFSVAGGNAGMGAIKAIKVGPNSNGIEEIKIYLDSPTHNERCPNGPVVISSTEVSERLYDHLLSVSLAAYASGKKVRYYSYTDNCNSTFVTFSEELV